MKQKTAMMELIERLNPILENGQFDFSYKAGIRSAISTATQLLQKEKEQIMDAFNYGSDYRNKITMPTDYYDVMYNETYKQD